MTLEVVVWFTFADHVLVYDSANFYRLGYCAKFVICNIRIILHGICIFMSSGFPNIIYHNTHKK